MDRTLGYPILPDSGTEDQRQNYVLLLKKVTNTYNMIGLPTNLSTLFENYTLPPNVPVKTPVFVFTEYPQHPHLRKHNFDTAHKLVTTARGQDGPANVLFNKDFTLVFGRVSSTKPHYGYRVMLLLNDNSGIYTIVADTTAKKSYRYSHRAILSDLQELVLLALYRYPDRLDIYRNGNDKIASYFKFGNIECNNRKYWPISCFNCKEAKYSIFSPKGKKGSSCINCYIQWKSKQKSYDDSEIPDSASVDPYIWDDDGHVIGVKY